MICPNCKYEDGWSAETMQTIDGGMGEFYALPIRVERDEFHAVESRRVYSCPQCGVLFSCA